MPTSRVNARVLIVKKILPLLLLATLGMLAALPHIAAANDQGDQALNGAHDQTDHEIGHETLAEFHIRLAGPQLDEYETRQESHVRSRGLFGHGLRLVPGHLGHQPRRCAVVPPAFRESREAATEGFFSQSEPSHSLGSLAYNLGFSMLSISSSLRASIAVAR